MKKISIDSLQGLETAAAEFIKETAGRKVFAFFGEMGAGKTTFIKAICQKMGVAENITSPTFSLINEYQTQSGELIYHFDCYRLKNMREAYDIGAEEYFYSGNYCFVEWPEKIDELLPSNTLNVRIQVVGSNQREVIIDE
jgi:tRNA threonylcarbamoyladenosine biosynthesis protein TsaE